MSNRLRRVALNDTPCNLGGTARRLAGAEKGRIFCAPLHSSHRAGWACQDHLIPGLSGDGSSIDRGARLA